jgi:serine protease Do
VEVKADFKKTENKKNNGDGHKARGAVLLTLVAATAGFGGGWLGAGSYNHQNQATSIEKQVISTESQLINKIANEVGESVVSINVTSETTAQDFFGGQQIYDQESAGTGVILNTDGIVVTNRHVIPPGAKEVNITLSDGTELDQVTVIGRTPDSDPLDIAFLQIDDKKGKDLKPAKLGKSADVAVGDKVVAIGNALGQFQNTVTSGIISGYGREVEANDGLGNDTETLLNLFQTDASINQGNSGGPLVNLAGEVIGINTAVAGGDAENIGFAIPIDDVAPVIKTVLEKGRLERPYLGVRYVMITDDVAYTYDLPTKRGAYIVPSVAGEPSIVADSPAAKAGIKEKDIITKIDGEELGERSNLVTLLGKKTVGSEITLTILRDGQEQQIKATLEAAPQS